MRSLLRWLVREGRRSDDEDSPEIGLIRFLSEQISVPQRAGAAMNAVSNFFKLDRTRQQHELPHVYLLLEQYLTEVDPVRRVSQAQLRERVRAQFPAAVASGPLALVFESPARQEILLCREFLLAVLDRTIQVLGGDSKSPLRVAKNWLETVPDQATEPVPFEASDRIPTDPGAWVETMIGIARGLHDVLDRSLGEGSDRIYDASYSGVAHQYSGLESFPVVIRLLPEDLLDEQRIHSLTRHRALERAQGELSDARRSALESASQLQAVLNTVGEGILTVDASAGIVLANREVESLFGYETADLIGVNLSHLLDPDDAVARALCHALSRGSTGHLPLGRTIQVRGLRKNGSTFPLELTLNETLISDELYFTAALQDVTIRLEYERGLVEAKEHAEEMDRLKTSFIANISHELRTPLTGILGSAQLLSDELGESQQEFTTYIIESGQRLLDTLSSILEFARLESGATPATIERIRLAPHVHRVVNRAAASASSKGLILEFVSVADDAIVEVGPTHLDRLIEILLENAIKFTSKGGVTVSVDRLKDHAVVRIRDTGIGIDPKFLPSLFQEFRQESDGLSRTHEGAGLGLAIARRLVESMDGTINVESAKDLGSTFSVQIPLAGARIEARRHAGADLPQHRSNRP